MTERNRVEFTGTIERLKLINTKSGNPMAKWLLCVGQDKFGCVALGNIADAILACSDGDQIGVIGTAKINNWKTDEGTWRNDFQITVWVVEIGDTVTDYQKMDKQAGSQQVPFDRAPPTSQIGRGENQYQGGPF